MKHYNFGVETFVEGGGKITTIFPLSNILDANEIRQILVDEGYPALVFGEPCASLQSLLAIEVGEEGV